MTSTTPSEAFHAWVACLVAGDMAGWAARATDGLAYTLWGTKTRSSNGHRLSVPFADRGLRPSAWEAGG